MLEAEGYSCDVFRVKTDPAGREAATVKGRAFWSAPGAIRVEFLSGNQPDSIDIARRGGGGINLLPRTRQYTRFADDPLEFRFFDLLSRPTTPGGPPVEFKTIPGRRVEEVTIPMAKLTEAELDGRTLGIKIDPASKLPVEVELTGFRPQDEITRLTNFRWGIQDATLFATTPPPGYTELILPPITEEDCLAYAVFGLRTFARYNNGRYPQVPVVFVSEQGEVLRQKMGLDQSVGGFEQPVPGQDWAATKEAEFAHGSYGLNYVQNAQTSESECRYRGESVTSRDATRVLLRWKRRDGRYQVIFGDLKTEIVAADRLKTLEGR